MNFSDFFIGLIAGYAAGLFSVVVMYLGYLMAKNQKETEITDKEKKS